VGTNLNKELFLLKLIKFMQQTRPNELQTNRLDNSQAGKLVRELIVQGSLTEEDLGNPDLIDLVNRTEQWIGIKNLSAGDEIFIVDTQYPREMIRGVVVYAGEYSTLGYNDKTFVTVDGVRITYRKCLDQGVVTKMLRKVIPQQVDVIDLASTEKIFKVIEEILLPAQRTRFVLES
jgi:hypothetical protein